MQPPAPEQVEKLTVYCQKLEPRDAARRAVMWSRGDAPIASRSEPLEGRAVAPGQVLVEDQIALVFVDQSTRIDPRVQQVEPLELPDRLRVVNQPALTTASSILPKQRGP